MPRYLPIDEEEPETNASKQFLAKRNVMTEFGHRFPRFLRWLVLGLCCEKADHSSRFNFYLVIFLSGTALYSIISVLFYSDVTFRELTSHYSKRYWQQAVLWPSTQTQSDLYFWLCIFFFVGLFTFFVCFSVIKSEHASRLKRSFRCGIIGIILSVCCIYISCCIDRARLQPFSQETEPVTGISQISVSANVHTFACVISVEGRLLCTNDLFKTQISSSHRNPDALKMFDVNGLSLQDASAEYGPSDRLRLFAVYHVSVAGSHICVASSSFLRINPKGADVFWKMEYFMRTFHDHPVVACFGYNNHGQLGSGDPRLLEDDDYTDDDQMYNPYPSEVPELSSDPRGDERRIHRNQTLSLLSFDDSVASLSSGHCHTCALTHNSALFCWGCNAYGQTGSDVFECRNSMECWSPTRVSFDHMNGVKPVVLSSAADNTCVIVLPTRSVVCWGRNNAQQLGRSNLSGIVAPREPGNIEYSDVPWYVSDLPGGALSISIGRSHICALFDDGSLRCWGSNEYEQIVAWPGDKYGSNHGDVCGRDHICRRPVVVHRGNSSVPRVQSFCSGNRVTCVLIQGNLSCIGSGVDSLDQNAGLNPVSMNFKLGIEEAVSVVCSVNEQQRDGLALFEYSYIASRIDYKQHGQFEAICITDSFGLAHCFGQQLCDDIDCNTEEDGADPFPFLAPLLHHKRMSLDFVQGLLLFSGIAFTLILAYIPVHIWVIPSHHELNALHAKLPHTAVEFELSDTSHRDNHLLPNIFVEKVMSMGFSERVANWALDASDGDEDAAMTLLVDHPEALNLDIDEEEKNVYEPVAGVGLSVKAISEKRKASPVFVPPSGLEIISHADLSFNALTQPKRGSFGTVRECIWRGARVAVKQPNVTSLTPRDQMRFERELETAAKIRGPNVVQLYAACLEVGHFALVMEWVDESLNERLRRSEPLSKEKRIRIAVDIASALMYLHSENIIHRDIKGHNVMIDSNGVAKLSDFGMSTLADHQASLSAEYSVKDAFTLAFAAPELIESGGRSFSACTDVYAFGVLMWELMGNGEAPYPGVPCPFIPDLVRRGERPKIQAAAATQFGPTYVKLMTECWCTDASARPSISQIYSLLSGIGAATANPWGRMQVTPTDFVPFASSLRQCCCLGFNGSVPDDMLDAMVAIVEAFVSQNANLRQFMSQVGLTELEAQCIAMYTYSNHPGASYSQKLYAEYNRAFYLRDAGAVERWNNFSHYFLSGLAKIPGQECVVYRGLDKPLTHISSHYIPGAHVCWNSLSSTTIDKDGTMRSFGNAASGSIAGTFVEIRALNAKNINILSLVPSEKELVLLPNSVFRVISAVSFSHVQQLQGLAAMPSGVDLIVLQQLS